MYPAVKKMGRPIAQRAILAKLGAAIAMGLVLVFAVLCMGLALGFRWNGTASFPIGLYLASRASLAKGDIVFADISDLSVFGMAKERGYLNVGASPAHLILKRIAGVSGDRVTIDSLGVEVNGVRIPNTIPLERDGAGRPLGTFILKDFILPSGEVLLISDYNPFSYDSRYFGPVPATAIQGRATPVLTWR